MRFYVKHLLIAVVALLVGRVVAAVPLAEWYTSTATLDLPSGWQTALNDRGRSASERRGNDIYLDNGSRKDLYVSGPVFSNGQYKALRGLAADLLCRTSLHVIMGDDQAAHLILAAHILGERRCPSEASIRGRIPRCNLSVSQPNCQIAARLDPKKAPCVLCSLLANATPRNEDHVFTVDEIAQIRHIYNGLLLQYNTCLAQYREWANREFGAVWAQVPLALNEKNKDRWPFHTEIMLLYDYREQPLPQKVYSRYSMCKSCEPALVQVAGRDEVWFISRCVYSESYIAGKTNASVKKAVVYSDGSVVPIGSIQTIGGQMALRNVPNPNNTTVFGGHTWQAEH